MKIISTIEARMSSRRFPGKVLKKIVGRPSICLLIERLFYAKKIDEIVLATTVNSCDDVLEDLAFSMGIKCFRGSESDVLSRVLGAANMINGDVIVEVTGDCLLLSPTVIDEAVQKYCNSEYDIVTNVDSANNINSYPMGIDAQVFSTNILQEVCDLTQDENDREHVSLYFYKHPEKYRIFIMTAPLKYRYPNIRLMVDYQDDFEFVKTIYEALYSRKTNFDLDDILSLINRMKKCTN